MNKLKQRKDERTRHEKSQVISVKMLALQMYEENQKMK